MNMNTYIVHYHYKHGHVGFYYRALIEAKNEKQAFMVVKNKISKYVPLSSIIIDNIEEWDGEPWL